jgi:histidinol dehydrogenase
MALPRSIRTAAGARVIRVLPSSAVTDVERLISPSSHQSPVVERRVRRIVSAVRDKGDGALIAFAKRLDGLTGPLEISRDEIEREARTVSPEVRRAIALAARNIRVVARRQVPRGWRVRTGTGVSVEQRVTPLERVGCYVPGGRYPLPSSLLMTAVPARVAGVGEIIAVCPRPDATVMFAALVAGVDRMFRIGGAHAIAALAYGTASIPRVDKIVGPGNAYVAAAKAMVAADCAIDFFAGPSEIVVVSSAGNAAWIAADLIAQAEHDPEARAILLTPSTRLAREVADECERQLPAVGPARAALASNGGIVITRTLAEAIALSQRLAPEHVVCDNDAVAARLTVAGTVFVGRYSAQALGDYVTGSNHVLPTQGAARGRGGLGAVDFVRLSNVQRVSRRGLGEVGTAAVTLALAEGLTAHAGSITVRSRRGHPGRGPLRTTNGNTE